MFWIKTSIATSQPGYLCYCLSKFLRLLINCLFINKKGFQTLKPQKWNSVSIYDDFLKIWNFTFWKKKIKNDNKWTNMNISCFIRLISFHTHLEWSWQNWWELLEHDRSREIKVVLLLLKIKLKMVINRSTQSWHNSTTPVKLIVE